MLATLLGSRPSPPGPPEAGLPMVRIPSTPSGRPGGHLPREQMSVVSITDEEDRSLIRRVGKGDERAFGTLFSRYAPTAKALSHRIVRRGHLAEEIVQEAFLSVWRSPDAYEPARGSVRAWIMTQIHHRSVDLIRREESQRKRAVEFSSDREANPSPGDDDPATAVAEAIDAPEERAALRGALGELPEAQRQVIELMYFEGLSQSKVAERLDVPLGTVKSRTLLGMRRMRSALEGMDR